MKIPKALLMSLVGALLILQTGGCFFASQKYHKVAYFDLKTPEPVEIEDVFVGFRLFNVLEPVKYKMVYHDESCQILIDDYNKWIQPPGFLLARYLRGAFRQKAVSVSPKLEFLVSGTIYRFKIDLAKREVALGVVYRVNRKLAGCDKFLVQNSLLFTAPIKDMSPAGFAEAISQCAEQLAKQLKVQFESLRHKELNENHKSYASDIATEA